MKQVSALSVSHVMLNYITYRIECNKYLKLVLGKVKFVDKLDVKCVDVQPSERSKAVSNFFIK